MAQVTAEDVYETLEQVIDPELGLDFVELGLIYDVEVQDGPEGQGAEVHITYSLTSPGCPIGPQIADQIKQFAIDMEGVDKVFPKLVFSPPWTPEMMSEDAKFALGY
jgi:metal-sulfur cluster biosynthetic enzyme